MEEEIGQEGHCPKSDTRSDGWLQTQRTMLSPFSDETEQRFYSLFKVSLVFSYDWLYGLQP